MSSKANNKEVLTNPVSNVVVSFNEDDLLKNYTLHTKSADGQDVVSYRMEVPIISGDNKGQLMAITDRVAIEAIEGIKVCQKLDKWISYKQGAYLVKLADSSFMKANEIGSINKLAQLIDLEIGRAHV